MKTVIGCGSRQSGLKPMSANRSISHWIPSLSAFRAPSKVVVPIGDDQCDQAGDPGRQVVTQERKAPDAGSQPRTSNLPGKPDIPVDRKISPFPEPGLPAKEAGHDRGVDPGRRLPPGDRLQVKRPPTATPLPCTVDPTPSRRRGTARSRPASVRALRIGKGGREPCPRPTPGPASRGGDRSMG